MVARLAPLLSLLVILLSAQMVPAQTDTTQHSQPLQVYRLKIMEDIMPSAWRQVQRGFAEAKEKQADIILLHMNTYGGMVDMADSIRTKILNSPIPVWVFIDNQAASAGALISIACDSIYMRKGASIGAATVVDQGGNVVPDKFQSFMRSTMRATAEAKGKKKRVVEGDTIEVWRRNPVIAEAMVDPSIRIEGIIDSGKVLTFTPEEAILNGFCEGKADNIQELFTQAGVASYELHEFRPNFLDLLIGFLTHPVVSALLIMVIVGGIYFELQTPGIGFPSAAAITAAILYFAPLYIEGLAEYYEVVIFVVGLILIAIEIFAIPGFGVTGITGIILVIVGLTVALIDNNIFRGTQPFLWKNLLQPLMVVTVSLFLGLVGAMALGRRFFESQFFSGLSLKSTLSEAEGYVGIDLQQKSMVGKEGLAKTMLRPSGKVEIEGRIYDAMTDGELIDHGIPVRVIRDEAGQLYVSSI